jgi:hypothetical protein
MDAVSTGRPAGVDDLELASELPALVLGAQNIGRLRDRVKCFHARTR